MTSDAARWIIAVGAMCAGLAVAIGAFGAHALEGRVSADMLANYETGARYHFYHALGMIGVGLFALIAVRDGQPESRALTRLRWAAVFLLTGIVLFSGSLYTMALSDLRWLGAVTPLGGVSFLVGWALFASAALDRP